MDMNPDENPEVEEQDLGENGAVAHNQQNIAQEDPEAAENIAQEDPEAAENIAQEDPEAAENIAQEDPEAEENIAQEDPGEEYDPGEDREVEQNFDGPVFRIERTYQESRFMRQLREFKKVVEAIQKLQDDVRVLKNNMAEEEKLDFYQKLFHSNSKSVYTKKIMKGLKEANETNEELKRLQRDLQTAMSQLFNFNFRDLVRIPRGNSSEMQKRSIKSLQEIKNCIEKRTAIIEKIHTLKDSPSVFPIGHYISIHNADSTAVQDEMFRRNLKMSLDKEVGIPELEEQIKRYEEFIFNYDYSTIFNAFILA